MTTAWWRSLSTQQSLCTCCLFVPIRHPGCMEATADMQTRHAAILGRLAELGMDLAEQLHADACAAETPAERGQIAATFHRISRSVRQTLALEARLLRMAP